jgi:hypothetical protein
VTAHSRRTSAALIGLAAALGGWTAHTVIYLLRSGPDGLPGALPAGLARSTHAYMVPLGLGLMALAAAWGAVGLRLWMRLGRRLERATVAIRAARRGRPVRTPINQASAPRVPARLASLALLILPAQLGLYVVQENLERAAVHVPVPGLAVLDGRAVLVHAAVVLLAAALLVPFLAPLTRRAQAVEQCEHLVQALLRVVRPAAGFTPSAASRWTATPIERFGALMWGRPPPALLSPTN